MSEILSWLITALIAVLLASFVFYVVGLRALPIGRRPRTPKYNRLGQMIGIGENPDYRENPGEDKVEGPDLRVEGT
jgi:hypothetical protein